MSAMDVDVDVDEPRGAKRKADSLDIDDAAAPTRRRIRPLDQDVVNKIAAGEIIVAPVHALKELMENAVDAGSTSLEVLVKDGGLKLLQITDNGCGIDKEDLPILCERFTTSKLQKFEDLQSIVTYGFRGEALASISHIAHLTVTTKTRDSDCAWRAFYKGGKLVPAKPGQSPDPKPVAGRPGTQVTVEDLFYNIPNRRRAFRSASDEYNKIIDMVGRYAVHCSNVGFLCKKHGESSASISIQTNASTIDRIRQIYGASVANELTEFSTSDNRWGFTAKGLATNANYSTKKTTLLLFINHRCVESSNIRKAIEQTYASFLPKNGHPFVYLSLEIDPQRVDVNVHPTKREVNFLNEDETIQAVCEHLRTKLAAVDASRTFLTQTLLPAGTRSGSDTQQHSSATLSKTKGNSAASTGRTPARNDSKLIRTDTNLRKITSMLAPVAGATSASAFQPNVEMVEYEAVEREINKERTYTSIRELRTAVKNDTHVELTGIFAKHTFVGVVDETRRLAAIQGGLNLYVVDYGRLCFEYFYQLGLTDYSNFGHIRLQPPLDLQKLLTVAAEAEAEASRTPLDDSDISEIVDLVANHLIDERQRQMLLGYFSIEISASGELSSIPILVKGYTPPLSKLPAFLLALGTKVDWEDEKSFFHTLLTELATFYVPERLPSASADEEDEEALDAGIKARRNHIRWAVEHVFFPAFKSRLVATKSLMDRGGVLEVANTKGLYKVFERC
ncbi:DNA mismatch repair protein Mlh1 [Podospora fimiseda]|uniref:DNA mismatch repair protein Mlh1 n=1 Tax=Podospora fimiseda TaxID=252190 RepID=A0AAN7BQT0_9PEZI|nr:DNA mismatch repair protein Mlh1 [Podospora fimiseda]